MNAADDDKLSKRQRLVLALIAVQTWILLYVWFRDDSSLGTLGIGLYVLLPIIGVPSVIAFYYALRWK